MVAQTERNAVEEQAMCRIISLSSLGRKAKEYVESLGGYGVVYDPEERSISVEEEKETAWELLVERDPVYMEGGIW